MIDINCEHEDWNKNSEKTYCAACVDEAAASRLKEYKQRVKEAISRIQLIHGMQHTDHIFDLIIKELGL